MNNIDLLMQINDGHNPYAHQNLIFGNGGLGYKPYGNMIGGMAMRDANGNLKTQFYSMDNGIFNYDVMKDYNLEEIPQLIDYDIGMNEYNANKKANFLLSEIYDIAKINNDDIEDYNNENFDINEKLRRQQELLSAIHVLNEEFISTISTISTQNNLSPYSGNIYAVIESIKNDIENGRKNNETFINETENYKVHNELEKLNYNLNDFSPNEQRPDYEYYFDRTQRQASRAIDEYKNLKKKGTREELETFKLANPDIEETKNKSGDYDSGIYRGFISEDEITNNPLITTVIDNDNSKLKNSKDLTAYNDNFLTSIDNFLNNKFIKSDEPLSIEQLNRINKRKEDYIDKLLKYLPFDGIKNHTIYELKSFTLRDKNTKYADEYAMTKLQESEYTINGDKYHFKFIYNVDNPEITSNGKIKGVSYDLYDPDIHGNIKNVKNISMTIKPKNSNEEIKIKNILPERNEGYNYFFLENTPKGFRFVNPTKEIKKGHEEFETNENYFDDYGNLRTKKTKKLKISQKHFNRLPPTYERQNKHKNVYDFIRERYNK